MLVPSGRASICCGVVRTTVPRSCARCFRLAVRAVLLGGVRWWRAGGSVPVLGAGGARRGAGVRSPLRLVSDPAEGRAYVALSGAGSGGRAGGGWEAPHHRLLAPPPGAWRITMRMLGPGLVGLTAGFWPHPLGGSIGCPQGNPTGEALLWMATGHLTLI